ncbi:unnamed protein product [Macrosiphum euphorbiae]|uniref:Helitron helicase-like domain-containing protein n=1 Tax=Macrosiphum euphorbiae TaxID=13131 RepID=A0AAV0XBN0_9HEMI|nr:unnamed protein product [Macrosiphum euphorbiae]
MYSIEWQKRGLPHVHILIWLENKIRPDDIDSLICAEIPDPIQVPILHEIVRKNMIHGPCGTFNGNSKCMSNGKCKKKFPKHFTTTTISGEDGYPNYRRRCIKSGGFSVKISCSDQATFPVEKQSKDEITSYQSGRYVSSSEAVWRILSFPIQERYPSVFHLSVHLENGQRVYFTTNNVTEKISKPPTTTLTAFFELLEDIQHV